MIARDEEKHKLAAAPCADCAVEFDGEKLDDDGDLSLVRAHTRRG